MLSHMNLQLQALDEELDNEFDAIVPQSTVNASLHRQEHAGMTNEK